jgi:uncharacterized protein (TIGR02145 family)
VKIETLTLIFVIAISISTFSQKPTMELTFTAENSGQHIPLDSVFIKNITQGGDTTLYAPDTVLILDYVASIEEKEAIGENTFSVSQNYPNPFKGKTEFKLYLSEKEHINITVRDIAGRELEHYEKTLKRGYHKFTFYSGNETYYLLTITGKQTTKTIKMLSVNSKTANKRKLVYNEYKDNTIGYKSYKDIDNFGFAPGDELEYTACSDMGVRTIADSPTGNQTYIFQYAVGEPCPGTPTVTDADGNVYNTVQIGSQCWMAENLKTTTYGNGISIPHVTNDSIWRNITTGAYAWYDNDIGWENLYGGLYNWYATINVNGLCPTGWHMPSNNEWIELTDFIGGADSPHGNELKSCRQLDSPLGDSCNTMEHPRWNQNNDDWGTDYYGFSALPGGNRNSFGTFNGLATGGNWWTSTVYSSTNAWYRSLYYFNGFVEAGDKNKIKGFSVRCIRN